MTAIRLGWLEMDGIPTVAEGTEPPPSRVPAFQPLSWGKRALLLITLAVLATIVVLPPVRRAQHGAAAAITDLGSAVRIPGPRQSADRWTTMAQMPTPRSRFAQVAVGNHIYVIAGEAASGPVSALEVYDTSHDSWSRLEPKPSAVSNVGAALIDGEIYVPGGIDITGTITTTVEVYDLQADNWSAGPPLPAPLCAYAIAEHAGSIYLFGGWDGTQFVDAVYRLEPGSDSWSQVSTLSPARGFSAAVSLDVGIVLVGGRDSGRDYALCQVYHPEGGDSPESAWETRAPLNHQRGGLALVSVERSLFAIGGSREEGQGLNERYDWAADRWVSFGSPFVGEWRNLGATVVDRPEGTMIYAIGGWSGDYLSANEQYQAIFRIHIPDVGD
jgi:hypothetical protein